MTFDELCAWMNEHQVGEVSCLVPDFSGAARGKSMTPQLFLDVFQKGGLKIPETTFAINVFGEFTYNAHVDRVERDLLLHSDLSTIHLAPWTKEKTACIICDAYGLGGAPHALASRQVLKDVVELYHQKGWRPIVGPEVEFYLIAPYQDIIIQPSAPLGASGLSEFGQHTFSLDAIDEFDDLFEEMYDFSEIQGIKIDTLIHEDGPCQFEINLRHADALEVADHLFLFKRLTRHVARRHGAFATFMAKPYADECGSSIHLHHSIVDRETGENIFASRDGEDTELFRHFIGGLQTHLPSAMPFIAPYTNSYNRFEAFMSAPTNIHWSRDNRTVGLRVPASAPEDRRIENRISGADVNPYLAIAASLICGYIGMVEGVDRKEEFIGQSYDDTDRPLPATLTEAIRKFRNSDTLRRYLGAPLIETFADMKQEEYEHRSSILSPWDVKYLMVNA